MLAILLSNWSFFISPLIVLAILFAIYGERFIIAFVLITLFTLVGELDPSLRTVVQLTDFVLLGYLFLKRFGLNFLSYKRVPKSVLYFLLLYFLTMILSSIFSEYPFAGIKIITLQFIFFIIVYVFYSLIKDDLDIKNYFLSIILVACILVTISLISFYLEGYSLLNIISKDRTRVSALISNFEAFSNFFVISVPILISFILFNRKNATKNNMTWFLLFYIGLGLILTMSRSSILGIVISVLIILFISKRKRFYQFILAVSLVSVIVLLYPPFNELISLLFRFEEGMSARDYLWSMSLNMIKDYPIFGIGPGAYNYELFNYYPFMLDDFYGKLFIYFADVAGGVNLAHNIFLVFFVDMGILGFITSLVLPLIYFRIGIKTIKKFREQNNYYIIIGLFAAGTSVIFRNIFNSIGLLYVGGIHTDLPFWLIFGSLIYFYRFQLPKSDSIND
jgi:O-antigen ligase